MGGINHNTLNHLLAAWQAKGLFEQVGRGVWRLKREPEQETETEVIIPQGFFEDDDSPSQKQDPLDADSLAVDEHVLRVRSYVQRHQPCKPALMAVDLSLDLEEVLGVLKSYGCFRMEEDGWTFRNGMVH